MKVYKVGSTFVKENFRTISLQILHLVDIHLLDVLKNRLHNFSQASTHKYNISKYMHACFNSLILYLW